MTGNEVADFIAKMGWSGRKFAKEAGVHPQQVGKWIRGQAPIRPYVKTIMRLYLRLRQIEEIAASVYVVAPPSRKRKRK